MTHDTPGPSFISRVEVAPGEPLTISATHVEHDPNGYRVVSGVGRQASTAGVAL